MIPHPDHKTIALNYAVITVSDSRTAETDLSGQTIQEYLNSSGHQLVFYKIIHDEPSQIEQLLTELGDRHDLAVVIFNGGTGIAPRDTTYDALVRHLEKTLPGFGEIFRSLSYQEIGSRAIASRALAGVYRQKLIFALPGSTNAVKLALSKLILPELVHLVGQITGIG